jgi:hypothetical protein
LEGNVSEPSLLLANQKDSLVLIRSAYLDAQVAPVLVGREAMFKRLAIKIAIGLDSSDSMPPLVMDVP